MNKHNHQTDLVFLPGWGFHATVFECLTPYFPEQRLHFLDLPPLNNRCISEVVHEVAHQLPPRSTLAGWSLGGLMAIELCAQFPERFDKLVLLASTPKFSAGADWQGINSARINAFIFAAKQDMQQCLHAFLKLVCFPAAARRAAEYFATHTIQDHAALLSYLPYLFQSDLRTACSNLTQPVLSIAGDRDAILAAEPANSLIISGAGHALFFTHAAAVCRHITSFLDAE